MAVKKKRPGGKASRSPASASRSNKSSARTKRVQRARTAEETEAKGDSFPTQVMGWSSTASDQLGAPLNSMLAATDGASTHLTQAMVQANVEVAALVSRRSRACLDFPAHLSKCQTPQQVLAQQSQFIREMLQDYHAAHDRIMKAWFEIRPPQ